MRLGCGAALQDLRQGISVGSIIGEVVFAHSTTLYGKRINSTALLVMLAVELGRLKTFLLTERNSTPRTSSRRDAPRNNLTNTNCYIICSFREI